MSKKREIYFSTDVETNGPIPGPNSMLSLGSAAYLINEGGGHLVDTFSINLDTLPGASEDPDTMKWWGTQGEAWEACRKECKDPKEAIGSFYAWVKEASSVWEATPVFVGYPATFDFLFIYWYLIKFVGSSPFSFSALDIKSFACAKLKTNFRETTKRNMPKQWFKGLPPHTHLALDDAIEQGALFCNIWLSD